jgi:hypothetical protein
MAMSDLPSQGDFLQAPSTDPVQTELAQLRQQVNHLRIWLFVVCAAVVPLTIAVDVFLAKQLRAARAQVKELRLQADRARGEFQRTREPNLRKYFEQLHLFAATNHDFRPVLDRYRPYLGQYYPVITPAVAAPLNVPPPAGLK